MLEFRLLHQGRLLVYTETREGQKLPYAKQIYGVAAICLHHNFNFASLVRDVVIYLVALLVTAALWKSRSWLYVAAAIVIALSSLAFLNASALGRPGEVKPFLNHVFLLLAGATAILAGISAFAKKRV